MKTLERLARAYTGAPFPSKQATKRMQAALDALTPGELIKLGADKAEARGLNGIGLMVDELRSRGYFVAKIEPIADAPKDGTWLAAWHEDVGVHRKIQWFWPSKSWIEQDGAPSIPHKEYTHFIRLDQLKPEGR